MNPKTHTIAQPKKYRKMVGFTDESFMAKVIRISEEKHISQEQAIISLTHHEEGIRERFHRLLGELDNVMLMYSLNGTETELRRMNNNIRRIYDLYFSRIADPFDCEDINIILEQVIQELKKED